MSFNWGAFINSVVYTVLATDHGAVAVAARSTSAALTT